MARARAHARTHARTRTHSRKQNNNSRIVLSQQLIRDFLKSIKKFYLTFS